MDSATREVVLSADSELRLEVSFEDPVEITLVEGLAEVFGSELTRQRAYSFSGCKIAIFTYRGCKLSISGTPQTEYVSSETPMHAILHFHLALENRRNKASLENSTGPKVLFIGSGRTSVSHTITNYAVKCGRRPIYADIDINTGSLLFPGNLYAVLMDRLIDYSDKFFLAYPISYFYGHAGGLSANTNSGNFGNLLPLENLKHFNILLEKLGNNVRDKLALNDVTNASGLMLTGPPYSDSPVFFELLNKIIGCFEIDVLAVVGNERLHSELTKKLQTQLPHLCIMKLPKSGGLVMKDANFRRLQMMRNIKSYFYGPQNEYSPFPVTVPFKDLHIRRIGEGPVAPSSALPLGASRRVDECRVVRVELSTTPSVIPNTVSVPPKSILNSVFAISQAPITDEASIVDAPIAGYVFVTGVDEFKNKVTFLSPVPGKFPYPYLILGSIKHFEQ